MIYDSGLDLAKSSPVHYYFKLLTKDEEVIK